MANPCRPLRRVPSSVLLVLGKPSHSEGAEEESGCRNTSQPMGRQCTLVVPEKTKPLVTGRSPRRDATLNIARSGIRNRNAVPRTTSDKRGGEKSYSTRCPWHLSIRKLFELRAETSIRGGVHY